VADLRSCNGTFIGGAQIVEAYLTGPCELRCGTKRLRFVPGPVQEVEVQAPERFGGLVGTTPEMIELFAKLERYAPTSMSIVIQGETGTGKERVAQTICEASPRRDKPFVPINCAAVADNLLEAELFGHVRGAFTGAERARDGLFVEADGGTLFFDEMGEMSSAMQAKLLVCSRLVKSGRWEQPAAAKWMCARSSPRTSICATRSTKDAFERISTSGWRR